MPLIDQVLEGAALVARQTTSALAATSATAAAASVAPNTTFLPEPSSTIDSPSPTDTGSGKSNNNGGSSPLLFFVALGFGVVFTNLWIIVGVKYCFRYNARARQMRLAAEDGEPINMENMPHPRRRRREKKLMTIDEVNEKFPMMKYKTWVASRALDGLPTRGGVDVPSRANSVRSAAGVIAPMTESQQPTKTITTTTTADADDGSTPMQSKATDTTTASAPATQPASGVVSTSANYDSATQPEGPANTRASIVSADGDAQKDRNSDEQDRQTDDDEDEHIDSALPPECVGTSGDTCAICIDTLEDDDDVRGLTCGHAFHAVCLDPWLTSRRACCPLCKADYYTPKPRASPAEGDANQHGMVTGVIPVVLEPGMSRHRTNIIRPSATWAGLRGPGSLLPARFTTGQRSSPRGQQEGGSVDDGASETQARSDQPAMSRSNWMGNLRPFRRRQDPASPAVSQPSPAATPAGAAANSEVTPSQLEAGVRN
ncbi:ring-8 protein [Ophiostoma piceae UAMH 11346]|uniref:Ring-8 protein n=1 Tax=Ophiostoma piceae (strain UAMH 11346) TaxID=1262450 RepID=S3CTQ9_OPHP1|nr:ring-8 protein [Ophiostoma piceae UAMH 11346]